LANIYAPNDDNPAFFSDFFDHLADFRSEEIVLDLEKDKSGGLPKTHQNSVKIIHDFSENLDLVDTPKPIDTLGENGILKLNGG